MTVSSKSSAGHLAFAGISLLLMLLLCPSVAAEEAKKHNVELVIAEEPSAKFAAFYWASKYGLYDKYALNVTIVHRYRNKQPALDLFGSRPGSVRVAVIPFLSALISEKNREIANICQLTREQKVVLIKRKNERNPATTTKQRFAYTGSALPLLPLLEQSKVVDGTSGVYVNNGVNLFIYSSKIGHGGNPGIDMLLSGEGQVGRLKASGYVEDKNITVLPIRSVLEDLPTIPGDAIYVSKKKLATNRDVLSSFVRATMEARAKAFQFEETALSLVATVRKDQKLATINSFQKELFEAHKKNLDDRLALDKKAFQKIVEYLTTKKVVKELYRRKKSIKLPALDCIKPGIPSGSEIPSFEEFVNESIIDPIRKAKGTDD